MKISGIEVTPCEEVLVLPRSDESNNLVFHAIAVSINDEFDEKCPKPVAPLIQKKGGSYRDTADKEYLAQVGRRAEQKFALMLIRSLAPSHIEWSEVDLDKPTTWTKWEKELKDAGLSQTECNRVANTVMIANSLDESKIKAAREAFLRGQGALLGKSSGQNIEQPST